MGMNARNDIHDFLTSRRGPDHPGAGGPARLRWPAVRQSAQTRGAANPARFLFLDACAPEVHLDWARQVGDTVAMLRFEAGRNPQDQARNAAALRVAGVPCRAGVSGRWRGTGLSRRTGRPR